MINREMKSVLVVSFATGTDAYGQPRKGQKTNREVQMMTKVYSQTNVDDIRFNDVTMIGLTKDNLITDENEVVIDGVPHAVLYVIPSNRYNQILMKKV